MELVKEHHTKTKKGRLIKMEKTLKFGEEQLIKMVELQNKVYKPSIQLHEDMSEEEERATRELKRVQREEKRQAREDMKQLKTEMVQWINSF